MYLIYLKKFSYSDFRKIIGALEEKLAGLRGRRTHILAARNEGEKVRLVRDGGRQMPPAGLKDLQADREQCRQLLERLQKRLRLVNAPVRIECFDNSNLFGTITGRGHGSIQKRQAGQIRIPDI